MTQEFFLTVRVVVNALSTVEEQDVRDALNDVLETFRGATAEVVDVIDIS